MFFKAACALGAVLALGVARASLLFGTAGIRTPAPPDADEPSTDEPAVVAIHDDWLDDFAVSSRPYARAFFTVEPQPPEPDRPPVVSGVRTVAGPDDGLVEVDLAGILPPIETANDGSGEFACAADYGALSAGTEDPVLGATVGRGAIAAGRVGGVGAAPAAGGGASGSGRPGVFAAGPPVVVVPSPGPAALVAVAVGLVVIRRKR